MTELQSSVSTQLQNELTLLHPHVQLLFLQLLQNLRTKQNGPILDFMQQEKLDHAQAMAELNNNLEKYMKMVAKMDKSLRADIQQTDDRVLKLEEAMKTEQLSIQELKEDLKSIISERNLDNEERKEDRISRTFDDRFQSENKNISDAPDNKIQLPNKNISDLVEVQADTSVIPNSDLPEDVTDYPELELNDQGDNLVYKTETESLSQHGQGEVKESIVDIKQLEAEEQNCTDQLRVYKDRVINLLLELNNNVTNDQNRTYRLNLVLQFVQKLTTDVMQLGNSPSWHQINDQKSLVQEVEKEILECSSALKTRTDDLHNVTQNVQDQKQNISVLQKRMDAAGEEVADLERKNLRLVAQRHDMEKKITVLHNELLQQKSVLEKCSLLEGHLRDEKALVKELRDLNGDCEARLQNRTRDVARLAAGLTTEEAKVQNLDLQVSNLTNQVTKVTNAAESRWKERLRSTANLLRYTTVLGAARSGDDQILQLLIEAGKSVSTRDVKDNLQRTPLHWAAREGYLKVVETLLEAGAWVEAKSDAGYTPLHEAAYNGHVEVCRLLLERGAKVDALNAYNNTPLHWAASNDHLATVQLLVRHGAQCDASNDGGQTPRSLARDYGNSGISNWMTYGCG